MRFVLHELHDSASIAKPARAVSEADAGADRFSILEEAGKFAEGVSAAAERQSGDEEGCTYENGVVRTPAGFKDAYKQFCEGGWTSALAAKPDISAGRGCRRSSTSMIEEMIVRHKYELRPLYPGLTHGAYQAIVDHATRRAEAALFAEDGGWHLVRHDVLDRGALRHRSGPAADEGGAGRGGRNVSHHGEQDIHFRRRA